MGWTPSRTTAGPALLPLLVPDPKVQPAQASLVSLGLRLRPATLQPVHRGPTPGGRSPAPKHRRRSRSLRPPFRGPGLPRPGVNHNRNFLSVKGRFRDLSRGRFPPASERARAAGSLVSWEVRDAGSDPSAEAPSQPRWRRRGSSPECPDDGSRGTERHRRKAAGGAGPGARGRGCSRTRRAGQRIVDPSCRVVERWQRGRPRITSSSSVGPLSVDLPRPCLQIQTSSHPRRPR